MPSSSLSRGNSWKGAIVQRADLDVVNDGPDKAVQIWQPSACGATGAPSSAQQDVVILAVTVAIDMMAHP
jgi:hypothetical protein